MSLDLLLRDVQAVLPNGVVQADLEVADGRIVGIVPAGSGGQADQVIDGGGREAFAGAIDPHAHFRAYRTIGVEGDEFVDLGVAAARGGVTSLIAFVIAPQELTGLAALEPILEVRPEVPVDYGLHHVLWPRPENIAGIAEVANAGVRSFKLFMAYAERGFMFTGPTALEAMERIAQVGGIALVHAEEGHAISWLERRGREALGSAATMSDYIASRPERLEAVAVDLAGLWASVTSCPLYIVHLSTAAGVETVRTLRRMGLDITVETCPHYLTLEQEQIVRIGPLGKFAPVLRSSEHQAALWDAVADGSISTIGSDHAAHAGSAKQELGCQHGIFETPFGIPGIETLVPLLYTFGVGTGRLTRERLSALISANVARRFGWFPQKGVLQVGSDADLILIDPSEERPVRAADLRSRAGYSPYEGMTLKGWPSLTLVRGKVVFDGKTVQAEGGRFKPTEPTAMKLRGGR